MKTVQETFSMYKKTLYNIQTCYNLGCQVLRPQYLLPTTFEYAHFTYNKTRPRQTDKNHQFQYYPVLLKMTHCMITTEKLVRSRRFELPRISPQRPQRCASTSSATTAYLIKLQQWPF